jgi:glycine/D-amino acid oxidase-like deaminating enzyme
MYTSEHSTASELDKSTVEELLPKALTSARDITGIPPAMPVSFWDEQSQLNQDYIIIGAGIIGLAAAVSLKESEPTARVLVLESGVLPAGASTRNAGFTCFGSLTEILEDMGVMGADKAIAQVKDRWEGLKLLRHALGDEAIGFNQTGNYELISEELVPKLEQLEHVNALLSPIFGGNVFIRMDERIKKFGFSSEHVKALVLNQFEGELDSGKMMRALQQKAQALGVVIRYGCEAGRPRNLVDGLEVPVKNNQGKTILFKAKAAAVCVNAYTGTLLPEFDIKPGRGQIIVTAPLEKPLQFKAPCHMGKGYWYFRTLPDNRILFGGGRNLNFSQETTTELSTTPDILGPLKEILKQVIVPGQDPKIDYSWAGLMGFSSDHMPRVEVVPTQPHLIIGFGCNGMGVARGFHTGQKTAALMQLNKALTKTPAEPKLTPEKSLLRSYQEQLSVLMTALKMKTDVLIMKGTKGSSLYDSEYEAVGGIASTLYQKLIDARDKCFNAYCKGNLKLFKNECQRAIELAQTTFAQHRGLWGQLNGVIQAMLGIVAFITVLPAVLVQWKAPHGYVGTFFENATDAALELNKFSSGINELPEEEQICSGKAAC